MTLGSLFDGSGGFPLAGALSGIRPVWAAEVEPYPIAVTRSRFPMMQHIGSRDDTTTFYRGTDGGIYVSCGCFNGTIDDFATRVKAVHAGTKHEKTYLLAIELAKAQIGTTEAERKC